MFSFTLVVIVLVGTTFGEYDVNIKSEIDRIKDCLKRIGKRLDKIGSDIKEMIEPNREKPTEPTEPPPVVETDSGEENVVTEPTRTVLGRRFPLSNALTSTVRPKQRGRWRTFKIDLSIHGGTEKKALYEYLSYLDVDTSNVYKASFSVPIPLTVQLRLYDVEYVSSNGSQVCKQQFDVKKDGSDYGLGDPSKSVESHYDDCNTPMSVVPKQYYPHVMKYVEKYYKEVNDKEAFKFEIEPPAYYRKIKNGTVYWVKHYVVYSAHARKSCGALVFTVSRESEVVFVNNVYCLL